MDLYLVRHAEAEPGGSAGDAARRLTRDGREDFARVVRGLDALGVRLDEIRHSPLVRAVETAEFLEDLLDDGGRRVEDGLLAEAPSAKLLEGLARERVALVGHEPWMSELLAWLLAGVPRGAPGLAFKKGGVAWLTGLPEPGRMTLVAFLPPRVTKRL